MPLLVDGSPWRAARARGHRRAASTLRRWPAAALMHLLVAGMQKTFLMLHDCCATACAHHMLQLLLLALCWCLCVADCSITMLLTRLGSLIEPGFVRTDPSLQ